MFVRTVTAALGVSGALLSPGLAQAPPNAAMRWNVDWGDQYCTLARMPADQASLILGIRTAPGSRSAGLRIMHPRGGNLPDRANGVALRPSGQSCEVGGEAERLQSGQRVLGLSSLPPDFWEALAGSEELQLRRDGEILHRFALINAAGAVRALRQCVSEVMREWGIDEAVQDRLRQLPRSTNHYGLDSVDYPSAALRERVGGRMLIRLTVSAEGRATECRTVATSGDALLDQAACPSILRFGRFTPAIDMDGRSVSATYVAPVRWVP